MTYKVGGILLITLQPCFWMDQEYKKKGLYEVVYENE